MDDLLHALEIVKRYKDKKKEDEIPDAGQLKNQELKVNNDIYALAYAALVDQNLLDKSIGGDCLKDIELNKREISNLYLGALLVICF